MYTYTFFGTGKERTENIKKGVTRAAGISTTILPRDFIAKADQIQNKGRKVCAIGIVQSFSPDEMDYRKPEDIAKVTELGYELAATLYPHSDFMVETHTDGKGHKLHNHIQVLNEDYSTGKAIEENRQLYKMREANDKLMKKHHLSVIPKKTKEEKREIESSKTKQNRLEHPETYQDFDFDTLLKKNINRAYSDLEQQSLKEKSTKHLTVDDFKQALDNHGVELKVKTKTITKKGSKVESTGFTYRMLDEHAVRHIADHRNGDFNGVTHAVQPRHRRRKASRLGTSYTYEGLQDTFEKIRERVAEAQKQAQIQSSELIQKDEKPKKKVKKIRIRHIDVGKVAAAPQKREKPKKVQTPTPAKKPPKKPEVRFEDTKEFKELQKNVAAINRHQQQAQDDYYKRW